MLVLVGAWWAGGLSSELVREAAGSSEPGDNHPRSGAAGRVPVTTGQVVVFLLIVLVFAAIAALLVWAAWKQAGGRPRVDDRAKSMAHVKDMDELTAKRKQAADAERLGASGASEGVPLAKLVNNRKRLLTSWEWVQLWIMGRVRVRPRACVCRRFWRRRGRWWPPRTSETSWISRGVLVRVRAWCGFMTRRASSVSLRPGTGIR